MTFVRFSKMHPLPAYEGPQPVYRATFATGGHACFVRRNGKVWETAQVMPYVQHADFAACPVAGASETRYAACMAFDYYHNCRRST